MTLLATELHSAETETIIVFAADRRITREANRDQDQVKIFPIRNINAGLGFFGLAEVPTSVGYQRMEDWIQDFLYTVEKHESVESVAKRLTVALNIVIPMKLRTERSGFHLAGFNDGGQPEFWYVRNVDDAGMPTLGQYEAREDFQRRDVLKLAPGHFQIYRNGDIRAHVTAWESLDIAFSSLLERPGFRPIRTVSDYLDWVRFKMEIIAAFYKRYALVPIIGKPIDVFAFSQSNFAQVLTTPTSSIES
ncbi:MAG: hypothetical protein KDI03_14335 [Anaerolineae bacterium]|nr:hypothetical protein [Anaerolineae bacterium]MCB0206829.1 hypothetical protein [Anaerolineae bacterium]MCB0252767.1 hypothetical protein [Anaerolineae bacterium]